MVLASQLGHGAGLRALRSAEGVGRAAALPKDHGCGSCECGNYVASPSLQQFHRQCYWAALRRAALGKAALRLLMGAR